MYLFSAALDLLSGRFFYIGVISVVAGRVPTDGDGLTLFISLSLWSLLMFASSVAFYLSLLFIA